MEIFNYQKFIGVIVFGYFAIKVYYNFLFENLDIKDSNKELIDLTITIVLASIVFLLTNFNNVMVNPIVYYIGFLVGTQSVAFKKLLTESITGSSFSDFLFYLIIIIYTIIFVYFYIIQNLGSSIISPLLVIISVISLIIGIILSSRKDIKQDTKTFVISKLNPNIGFFSFLGALLMVHSSGENIIVSFFQSVLIGSFVSYFSYYQPEFIIEKNDSNTLKNISLLNLNNALFNNNDSDTISINEKTISDLLEKMNQSINNNLGEMKTSLNNTILNSLKVDSFEQDIKTNRIVSGLSYVTILVAITIIYVYYGSDVSLNSK
tara:strand:+ start:194 stop:1153 length:960 start_codon:yes stop_codon:yes gene_type:complete